MKRFRRMFNVVRSVVHPRWVLIALLALPATLEGGQILLSNLSQPPANLYLGFTNAIIEAVSFSTSQTGSLLLNASIDISASSGTTFFAQLGQRNASNDRAKSDDLQR
jgi:hypothetical protein